MSDKRTNQIVVRGTPRVDFLSLLDESDTTSHRPAVRSSRARGKVNLTVRMGGYSIAETLINRFSDDARVEVASGREPIKAMIGTMLESMTGEIFVLLKDYVRHANDDQLLSFLANPYIGGKQTALATFHSTIWRQYEQKGKIDGEKVPDKALRYSESAGYDIGGFNRAMLIDNLWSNLNLYGRSILVFDDGGWHHATLPNSTREDIRTAINNARVMMPPFKHVISTLESGKSLDHSVAYKLFCKNNATFNHKLTLVTNITHLRGFGADVRLALSWELTFSSITKSVANVIAPRIDSAFRLIVMIDLCGAVLLEFDPKGKEGEADSRIKTATLIYDQCRQETDIWHDYKGSTLGMQQAMMSVLASDLEKVTDWDNHVTADFWKSSVREGLSVARRLQVEGYIRGKNTQFNEIDVPYNELQRIYESSLTKYVAVEKKKTDNSLPFWMSVDRSDPGLFRGRLNSTADTNTKPSLDANEGVDLKIFDAIDLGDLGPNKFKLEWEKNRSENAWSILDSEISRHARYPIGGKDSYLSLKTRFDVRTMGRNIVIEGEQKALRVIPMMRLKKWSSADRTEIEGVRTVRNALSEYLLRKEGHGRHEFKIGAESETEKKPVSIAVFGPPGSGKSFAVSQIADSLGTDQKIQPVTFNLSQFESIADLFNAFQTVRDINLDGKTPLVFWDEFDSMRGDTKLGWLKYFLAPMQDGKFTQEGQSHPIGPGIYVFAGGTKWSYRDFVDSQAPSESKKTDFESRLSAYIDVKGPNGDPNSLEDTLMPIRRGFLLRSQLSLHAPTIWHENSYGEQTVEINDQVIRGFLSTSRYAHGARSIENIIKLSDLRNHNKFEISNLPPLPSLEMQVSPKNFLAYVNNECMFRMRFALDIVKTDSSPDFYKKVATLVSDKTNDVIAEVSSEAIKWIKDPDHSSDDEAQESPIILPTYIFAFDSVYESLSEQLNLMEAIISVTNNLRFVIIVPRDVKHFLETLRNEHDLDMHKATQSNRSIVETISSITTRKVTSFTRASIDRITTILLDSRNEVIDVRKTKSNKWQECNPKNFMKENCERILEIDKYKVSVKPVGE